MRARPVTFLALLGAVLVFAVPQLQPLLIYDREAILAGEVWRLFTGNWVHFSASHLVLDLVVLGVAGAIMESRRAACWPRVLLLSPWVIGVGLLVCEPRMSFYGGLSGVATAAVVCLALDALHSGFIARWAGATVLLLIAAKLAFEWGTGSALFVGTSGTEFVTSPLSHLLGGLSAVGVRWLWPEGEACMETSLDSPVRFTGQR